MCAGRKQTNHATQAGAQQNHQPTPDGGPGLHSKYATSRWSAESAANRPTAHGNKPNRTPRLSRLCALGARPVGHIANRSSERVGGMVGMRHVIQAQNLLHHVLDLVFFGGALAHYRELDLARREFANHKPALRARHERRTTSLPRGKRRRDVLPEPYGFDADACRLKAINHGSYLLRDFQQALRKFH